MNKYLTVFRLGWLDALEYRTEFFVSVIGWGIRVFIALFLWLAVFEAKGSDVGSYSFSGIVRYFFIVQIISGFIFSRVGFDIAHDIYRGDFSNFLLKPMNYLSFRLIHEMSKNLFRTLIALFIFGTTVFIGFGGIPLALWKIPLGIVAIIGSYLINSCLVCIIALSAFWIINAMRLSFIYFGILTILSGMIIPVDLFPQKIFAVFQLLPFSYIFYFPASILQSEMYQASFLNGFAIQWMYIFILMGILSLFYRQGIKRFEAVGR